LEEPFQTVLKEELPTKSIEELEPFFYREEPEPKKMASSGSSSHSLSFALRGAVLPNDLLKKNNGSYR
jgi:hypothetical protein